VGTNYMSVPIH